MNRYRYMYGLHAVRSLLSEHNVKVGKLFLQRNLRNERIKNILNVAMERSIPVHIVERKVLSKLAENSLIQEIQ